MWNTAERATTISLSPPSIPRLRLHPPRPSGLGRALLDGGWWPRSTDPVGELPGLILALQTHACADDHGPIVHVLLRVADWDGRPRRLRVDGPADARVVRLSWFDSLPAGLLTAICADGHRLDLLTVPVDSGPAEAWAAMELAAHTANHLHTPHLLATLGTATGPADRAETEERRRTWESEGGQWRESPATP
ncbi:DUF5994 family protein [Thermomonospora umbrina]|nr:DUF5994 family protein [Thermomonospora umbrina]